MARRLDLTRRCECGRKPSHDDSLYYESPDGGFIIACKSCKRLIARWSHLPPHLKKVMVSLGRKFSESDYGALDDGRVSFSDRDLPTLVAPTTQAA